MAQFPPILLAAGWETLVAVVIFILWAVGQAMEAKKKKAAPQKPLAPQPVRPVPPKPQQAAAQQQPPDRLREQVDEFLRRAGRKADEMGPGPKPQRVQPAPAPQLVPAAAEREMDIEVVLDDDMDNPPPRQLVQSAGDAKRGRRHQPRKLAAAPPHHESVAEHVAEHVGSRTFAERTSHLGEQVAQADEKIEAHLHHKFDRELGTLGRSSVAPTAQSPPADSLATEIAAMLASPAGMRQAIVLGEILQRPEHRW